MWDFYNINLNCEKTWNIFEEFLLLAVEIFLKFRPTPKKFEKTFIGLFFIFGNFKQFIKCRPSRCQDNGTKSC